MINSRIWLALVSVPFALVTMGCGRQEEIRKYEVPKRGSVTAENSHLPRERFRELAKQNEGRDGIYGAMAALGRHLYLIELAGPRERLENHSDKFFDFVESLEFLYSIEVMGGLPPGTTVPGWKRTHKPGALLAFEIEGEEDPLVLTVTRAPLRNRVLTSRAMTSVINSWRRQLLLRPVSHDGMPDHTACFHVRNMVVVAVSFAGKRVEDERDATGLPAGHPPVGQGAAAPGGNLHGERPSADSAAPIDFVVPEGWKPGQRVVSRGGVIITRPVAFVVADGEANVEITATVLPSAGAELGPNVVRWRRQLGLGPPTDEQLRQMAQEVPVGEVTGQYIEVIAPEDAPRRSVIFAAIAVHDDSAWVFTLKGDFDLAQRQRESYLAFLKSIQFKQTDGADDGD